MLSALWLVTAEFGG